MFAFKINAKKDSSKYKQITESIYIQKKREMYYIKYKY
jgi:hypothetical protein